MDPYNDIPSIEFLIKEHLKKYRIEDAKESASWHIAKSEKFGRSVFATRDIEPNELICSDLPLLIGFTGNGCKTIICVCCYKQVTASDLCPNQCGLSICKDCPKILNHKNECDLLRSWNPIQMDTVSGMKLKSLSSFRALLLNDSDQKLLDCLQANRSAKNEEHIDVTISEFKAFNKDDQSVIEKLKRVSSVMNTNSFQNRITKDTDEVNISIRVLYPYLAFLNHRCIPNTRRSVDPNHIAHLYAVKKIKKGEEITTSYSQILWSTPSRQAYFKVTKDFQCSCDRCLDPTEFDTYLSGLKCLAKPCPGIILPLEPDNINSAWKCDQCTNQFQSTKIYQAQSVLSSITNSKLTTGSISEIIDFIDNRLTKMMPESSQMVIEMKLAALRKIGSKHEKGIKLNRRL